MTIKEIKEVYAKYDMDEGDTSTNRFIVENDKEWGKVVVVAEHSKSGGWWVKQAVRCSDGAELIPRGGTRPADDRNDAVDVAWEMIYEDGR